MQWLKDASLTAFNTLKLNSKTRFLAIAQSEADILTVLDSVPAYRFGVFLLGGGSNVLLPEQLHKIVLMPALKGITARELPQQQVQVDVMAGESWTHFVDYSVAQGWYGLENLSLIPGSVGASPVQNIGAYGVEVGSCIESVRALHLPSQRWHELTAAECQFAYRHSMFKQQAGDWLISRVCFRLSRQPQLVLDYGDLRQQAGRNPTPQRVAATVRAIRQQKLPNPQQIPNCGSYFQNPVVSQAQFLELKAHYSSIAGYPQPHGVKLAAGWLIEQAGWRGRFLGPVGMYERQALVLVNTNNGQLHDVLALEQAVIDSVWQKFAVQLVREPVLAQ